MGSAISSSLSLINHSCDANSVAFFVGEQILVTPIRHIEQVYQGQKLKFLLAYFSPKTLQGEEITIGYDDLHHEDMPLMTRQFSCLKKFHFSCECEACQGDFI